MQTVLKAENVSKIYGSPGKSQLTYTALDNISLSITAGEFVGVMGPSGSGKTTLLNVLATVDGPTSGSVQINGKDPARLPDRELALFRRRQIGFVFQDFNLLDTLTVRENILLPLALDRVNLKEMDARLAEVARVLDIGPILDKRTYEISGGQKQRTAIARAIIHKPAIIFADELTGNLDSKAAQDVLHSLRSLNEDLGATILMVTHDPLAASYCRRIIFIRDGQLYSELRRGDDRQRFYQQILDALSLMGSNAAAPGSSPAARGSNAASGTAPGGQPR